MRIFIFLQTGNKYIHNKTDMKKIFYLPLVAIILAACGQSQEQKAEALIKEDLKKVLFKPETYKPIDIKVDSAFAPYDSKAFYEEIMELGGLATESERLKEKAKRDKSSMALWSGPYQTALAKNEYQEAKEEYDEANDMIEKLETKCQKYLVKIAEELQGERKFIGYKALHNYRADNNEGNILIGNSVFFIDENFTEILYSLDVDVYNQLQSTISNMKKKIEGEEE